MTGKRFYLLVVFCYFIRRRIWHQEISGPQERLKIRLPHKEVVQDLDIHPIIQPTDVSQRSKRSKRSTCPSHGTSSLKRTTATLRSGETIAWTKEKKLNYFEQVPQSSGQFPQKWDDQIIILHSVIRLHVPWKCHESRKMERKDMDHGLLLWFSLLFEETPCLFQQKMCSTCDGLIHLCQVQSPNMKLVRRIQPTDMKVGFPQGIASKMEVSKNVDNTELFPFILGVLKSACKGLQTLLGVFLEAIHAGTFFSVRKVFGVACLLSVVMQNYSMEI